MRVTVTIPPGDNPSPDTIVDPLCTTESIGVLRGKTYLYDQLDKLLYNLTMKIPRAVTCGEIVQFYDPDLNTMVKGKITSWSNQCSVSDSGEMDYVQNLSIEVSVLP